MLADINQKFALDGQLRFVEHYSGLIQGIINTELCQASFFLLGGHVAEFQPAGQEPILFMSQASTFEEGKPIRGGVPICFPWFGSHKLDDSLPSHGLVRTQVWDLVSTASDHQVVSVGLQYDLPGLSAKYELQFGSALDLALTVSNHSTSQQSYELALHTYFNISNVEQVHITGLETLPYLDQLSKKTVEAAGTNIAFTEETDRVYQGEISSVCLHDAGHKRVIEIMPRGSKSTVVWNPWTAKSQRMPDFGDTEFPNMCCIETANVAPNDITLGAGESHTTGAKIKLQ